MVIKLISNKNILNLFISLHSKDLNPIGASFLKFLNIAKLNLGIGIFFKLRLGASRSRSVGRSVCRSVGLSSKQDSKQAVQTEFPNKLCIVFPNKPQEKISCILCGNYAKLVWKPCLEFRSSGRAYVPIDRGPATVLCQVLLLSTIQASASSSMVL